ncbi:MAG TPA: lysozyme [Caulobacteraceae bacterium]|nr:lysozyme [Caulobacteraceae bacterium]
MGPYADDLDQLIQSGRANAAGWPPSDADATPDFSAMPAATGAAGAPAFIAASSLGVDTGSNDDASDLLLPQSSDAAADASQTLSSTPSWMGARVADLSPVSPSGRAPRPRTEPTAPNGGMKISDDGLNFIKGFESWSPTVYNDQGHAPTIGWGHLIESGEHFFGRSLTPEEGFRLLRRDVGSAENMVNAQVHVPLNQGQFDAMVSFAFNTKGFANSSVVRALNRGDYAGAANNLSRYVHVNVGHGQWIVSRGLVRRRAGEQQMFYGSTGRSSPVGLRGSEIP